MALTSKQNLAASGLVSSTLWYPADAPALATKTSMCEIEMGFCPCAEAAAVSRVTSDVLSMDGSASSRGSTMSALESAVARERSDCEVSSAGLRTVATTVVAERRRRSAVSCFPMPTCRQRECSLNRKCEALCRSYRYFLTYCREVIFGWCEI